MKRVLSLTSLILVLVLCLFMFASCGMNSYEKKLDKEGYAVETWDEDEIKENLAMIGIDADKVNVKAVLNASKGLNGITIIKVGSKDDAEDIADSLKLAAALTDTDVVQDGKYVFFGTEDALEVVGK